MTIVKNHISLLIFLLLILGASALHKKYERPDIKVSAQDVERNFNIPFLKAISFGHKNFLADLFWIQTMIESDIEHYKKKDLGSWMYLRFKTVIELAPKFLEAYQWGSQYLMIVKDDLIGSEKLLDMGLKKFPDDYQLNYYKGFLYMSEYKDIKRALPYFEKVMFYPQSPPFMAAMVARLRYKNKFNKDQYLLFLKDLYIRSKREKRNRIQRYLQKRIRELEQAP